MFTNSHNTWIENTYISSHIHRYAHKNSHIYVHTGMHTYRHDYIYTSTDMLTSCIHAHIYIFTLVHT